MASLLCSRRREALEGKTMVSSRSGARSRAGFPGDITTLVLDVLVTVVDEYGSMLAETAAAFAAAGIPEDRAEPAVHQWARRLSGLVERVRLGEEHWQTYDVLSERALRDALEAAGPPALPEDGVAELALVGHRLTPWPDAAPALARLAETFAVVALTNGSLAQTTDLSAGAGLTWHGLLTADAAKTYKPDPALYRMALDWLQLDPRHTLFVAAHPWDLRAARSHGYRTAFLARPGAEEPDDPAEFDLHCTDLAQLADELIAAAK